MLRIIAPVCRTNRWMRLPLMIHRIELETKLAWRFHLAVDLPFR